MEAYYWQAHDRYLSDHVDGSDCLQPWNLTSQ
jgi:hypothetical protein